MKYDLVEVMQDEVRTLYRALTGSDIPDVDEVAGDEGAHAAGEASEEALTRRFAALEALARGQSRVAGKIPPFSFTPALNAIEGDDEVLVEVALPGIDRDDVTVEVRGGELVITGLRRDPRGSNGGTFMRGEIPRGPFYRAFRPPFAADGEPHVELDRGLLRVRLRRAEERAAGEGEA